MQLYINHEMISADFDQKWNRYRADIPYTLLWERI